MRRLMTCLRISLAALVVFHAMAVITQLVL